jgi:hypothetical protein
MKWAKTKAFTNNKVAAIARFLYEHIITKFDYLLELTSDQGGHFINETIEILTAKFMINYKKATTYYPQGNGQAKNTNKVLEGI